MHNPITIMSNILSRLTLVFVVGMSGGCALWPSRLAPEYYLVKPTLVEQITDKERSDADLPISDVDVVRIANDIKTVLRERFNNARFARSSSGLIQVVTAAVSSLLTGTSGGSAIGAATILSGTSAIIPEVSQVIGAKERAEAYSDGIKTIEKAEARYLDAVSQRLVADKRGKISGKELTPEGAKLWNSVRAARNIVRQRLAGQLPSLKEIMEADGEPEPSTSP